MIAGRVVEAEGGYGEFAAGAGDVGGGKLDGFVGVAFGEIVQVDVGVEMAGDYVVYGRGEDGLFGASERKARSERVVVMTMMGVLGNIEIY